MSIRKKRKLSTLRKNCHISQSGQLILVTFGVHFLYSLKVRTFFNLSDICFRNFHWLHFKCGNKTGQLLNEIIVLKEKIMRRTTNRTTKLQIYRSFLFAPSLLPESICVMPTIFEEEILYRFCFTLNKYCQVDKMMEIMRYNRRNNLKSIEVFNIKERCSKRLKNANDTLGKRDKKETDSL